jgi:hypothetical protein
MLLDFFEWLSATIITINMVPLKNALTNAAKELENWTFSRKEKLKSFNPEQFFQELERDFSNYPNIKKLINALNSKNPHYIFDQQSKFRDWLSTQPYNSAKSNIHSKIYLYTDKISPDYGETNYNEVIKDNLKESYKNMLSIKKSIEEAISRITNWNKSSIEIEADPSYNEMSKVSFDPSTSCQIKLNKSASFSYFVYENKAIIDDIIEADDTDFFSSPETKNDYFNLINEIKNPGSTSKGKVLTLYTARPTKDREQFLTNKKLPANLFLCNSYDHVDGLASELAGSEKRRDIWKVRINSKYLTQTLDGKIKYYQITSQNAEVESMDLIQQG